MNTHEFYIIFFEWFEFYTLKNDIDYPFLKEN